MNKLQMAHDYLKVLLTQNTSRTVGEAVETAYALADAMQAEADKREPKGFTDVLQTEVDWEGKTTKELKMLIKTLDGILQSRGDCQHEWDHISAYGGSGDYLVCPCGAEKHNL